MSSAAVVIGALRVKIFFLPLNDHMMFSCHYDDLFEQLLQHNTDTLLHDSVTVPVNMNTTVAATKILLL